MIRNLLRMTLAATLFTVACTSEKETTIYSEKAIESGKIDLNEISKDEHLNDSQKAEEIALIGESLFTPNSFMYAHEIFQKALSIDPKNIRAQFYTVYTKQAMNMKGMLTRIQPLTKGNEFLAERHSYSLSALKTNPALLQFLTEQTEEGPINNEGDLQMMLQSQFAIQDEARLFFKENKDFELTLHMNNWSIGLTINQNLRECKINRPQPDVYEFDPTKCDFRNVTSLEVNRADLEALHQASAGVLIGNIISTAYRIDGSSAFMDKADKRRTEIRERNKERNVFDRIQAIPFTDQETWNELTKLPAFGGLKKTQMLKTIISFGADAIAGAAWIGKNQDTLCKFNVFHVNNRPGTLNRDGYCLGNKHGVTALDIVLKNIELALGGAVVSVNMENKSEGKQANVKPVELLLNPIQDIRSLKPMFNNCGDLAAFGDTTFGGAFVDKNVNSFVRLNPDCHR